LCRQYPGLSSRNGLNLTRACRHKVIVQSAEDHSVIAEKTTDASGILVFDVPAGRYIVLGFGDQPENNSNTHFVTSSDQAKFVIQPFHQHPASVVSRNQLA